jgi:hypothetical protein
MGINGKFIGDTKGNANLKPCLSDGGMGGAGESHSGAPSSKFIGPTKGNTDLKIDRTSGVKADMGGAYKAGRNGKPFTGNTEGPP